MRLTHAMPPTIVLLVQALEPARETVWEEDGHVEAVTSSKVLWSQDGRNICLIWVNCVIDLRAVELPVPEEFQPFIILASLPASYTAIVQTLGSQAGKTRPVARDQYDHGWRCQKEEVVAALIYLFIYLLSFI